MALYTIPYMYVAFIVTGLTACTANATLIWIILRNKNFITASNVIVVSLATSDFLLGIVISPVEMMHHLLLPFSIEGFGCLAHQVIMIFIPSVSIFHLLLIAVERFIKIVYPLHYHFIATRRLIGCLIFVAWIFPFTLCVLPFFDVHQNLNSNTTDTECLTLDLIPCPYLYSVVIIIFVICITMAVLYSKIISIAYRHAKQIRELSVPKPSNIGLFRSSDFRALIVLLMTVVYFVCSWTPFSISIFKTCASGFIFSRSFYDLSVFIAYLNATFNPLIYGLGNKELRISLFYRLCRKKRTKVFPAVTEIATLPLKTTFNTLKTTPL